MHSERREYLRLDYESKVVFRELKENKLSNKHEILTRDVSASGVLFRTAQVPPALGTIICVEMDDKMVNVCSEVEEELITRDNGILGRVVRISEGEPGVSYDVGVAFLRRQKMSDEELCDLLSE